MTPEQFNTLFRAHMPEVSRFLTRRVEPESVEDLAAELFSIAWGKRDSIPQGYELPWLYKTARYLISNHRKKVSNRARIELLMARPEAAPSAESIAIADTELSSAWRKLQLLERELIALWAFEGLSNKEIGLALEISENAAAIRLTRAKQKLKTLLEAENNEHDGTVD
jgi:RNA polymerase sigma-70 factor (ECF subfamily)